MVNATIDATEWSLAGSRIARIDSTHTNPKTAYTAMGAPAYPTADEVRSLEVSSEVVWTTLAPPPQRCTEVDRTVHARVVVTGCDVEGVWSAACALVCIAAWHRSTALTVVPYLSQAVYRRHTQCRCTWTVWRSSTCPACSERGRGAWRTGLLARVWR